MNIQDTDTKDTKYCNQTKTAHTKLIRGIRFPPHPNNVSTLPCETDGTATSQTVDSGADNGSQPASTAACSSLAAAGVPADDRRLLPRLPTTHSRHHNTVTRRQLRRCRISIHIHIRYPQKTLQVSSGPSISPQYLDAFPCPFPSFPFPFPFLPSLFLSSPPLPLEVGHLNSS